MIMGKTLETKKRILNLLKRKEMTATELSRELGLSTATVSQHLDELRDAGAIEKIDNEHFKKLKYYKLNEAPEAAPMLAKYAIGAVVALLLIGSFIYFYHGGSPVSPLGSQSAANGSVTTATEITHTGTAGNGTAVGNVTPGGGGAFACPMMFYSINGTVTGYSGFTLYNVTSGNYTYRDYVLGSNSSGRLNVTETVTRVLSEPSGFNATREHYAALYEQGMARATFASGEWNVTISPQSFTVLANETVNATVTLVPNATVTNSTYLLRIDGPCGPGVTPVLVTVGSGPYHGNVTFASAFP